MSAVYQPKIMEDNKWVKHGLDDFLFSTGFTASGGQPIFLAMSGTVYSGGTGSYGSGGNIYGGAISSGSGIATTGRPPQIGRNSIYAPGYYNWDMRVTREIPIWDRVKFQLIGEAFNVMNNRIITGVNGTYSQYTSTAATGATAAYCPTGGAAPAGSALQGCILPFTGTGSSAFGAPSTTGNSLYGPRQLQVSAKLSF